MSQKLENPNTYNQEYNVMRKLRVTHEEIICVEVSNAMIAQIVDFWLVTMCSLVFRIKVHSVKNWFSYMGMLQGMWPF
jgi:hypothetical protein